MSLKGKLRRGDFAVTGELAPGKGAAREAVMEAVEHLRGVVDAVNVTDNQRSCVRASSMAVSKVLLESGVEPVFQLTCRDRNRIALQSDLLGAHMLGIRNVLILSGDHPRGGDHPEAMPVYDLDSTQLLSAVKGLNGGCDMKGNMLSGATDFLVGAACDPGAGDLDVELERVRRKSEAGADFFQSQVVYDADGFKTFMKGAKNAKVLAGVIPLKSKRMADFMNEKIPNVHVPKHLIAELERSEDPVETGIKQAAEIIRQVRPYCSGVHIMALGMQEHVGRILEDAGIR
jgi:methylenetetrahydrofolate reductase (NADPH)